MRYRFAGFELDTVSGRLHGQAREIELQPLSLALLTFLLDHPGQLFSRDELLKRVWPDAVVSDESLSKAVSRLRKALGRKDVVETVPRRGYRLAVPVERGAPSVQSRGVPTYADARFGRDDELANLSDRYAAGQRLITLKGPSGTGKTRLAVELCARAVEPVLFADLTACRTADDVVHTTAVALDLEASDVRRVGYALGRLGRVLVVLDNFEPVAEHAAETLGWWLRDAPDAAFLVTSQVVLGIRGERVVELDRLPLRAAAAMFADRADLPDDTDGIEALVEALDGLPLAIELAASRARLMTPRALLDRLGDRFALLRAQHPDRPERHTSLEAALGASWELLDEASREAMGSLSVFAGPFDVEAADAVAGGGLDRLQRLVDHSMIRVDRSRARFRVPDAIRDFASFQVEPGALEDARERLVRWLARFGSPDQLDRLRDHTSDSPLDRIGEWRTELRWAVEWAIDRGQVALAESCVLALWPSMRVSGPFAPIADQLCQVADLPGLAMPFRVLHAAAQALALAGDTHRAEQLGRRLLACAEQEGNLTRLAIAHLELAQALYPRSPAARQHVELALDAARESGSTREEGTALLFLANIERAAGDWVRFAELAERGVDVLKSLDDPRLGSVLLANSALIHQARGQADLAVPEFEAGIGDARARGDRLREAELLGLLGQVYTSLDDHVSASTRHEQAAEVWGELGRPGKQARELERAAAALEALEAGSGAALTRRAQRIRDALGQ